MFKKWSVLGGKKVEGKKAYTPPTIPSDDTAMAVHGQAGGGEGAGNLPRTPEEELWLSGEAGAMPPRPADAQQAGSNPMFDGMRVAEAGGGHAPHGSERAAAAGSESAFSFMAGQEQGSASPSSFGFINPGDSSAAASHYGQQQQQQQQQATTPSAAARGAEPSPSSSSFSFITQSPADVAPPPVDGSGAKKKKMAARRPGYAAREGSGSPAPASTSSRRAAVEAAVAAAVAPPPPPQTPPPPQRPSDDTDAARQIQEEEEEEERAALEMERAALALQAELDCGLGADEAFIDQGMKAAEEASLKQLQEDERARAAYENEQMRVMLAIHPPSSPSPPPARVLCVLD